VKYNAHTHNVFLSRRSLDARPIRRLLILSKSFSPRTIEMFRIPFEMPVSAAVAVVMEPNRCMHRFEERGRFSRGTWLAGRATLLRRRPTRTRFFVAETRQRARRYIQPSVNAEDIKR